MNKAASPLKLRGETEEQTLRDMLTPLFRQRRALIVVFSCVSLLAIFFAWFWASRYYVSQMQIVVDRDRSDPAITAAPNAAVLNNSQVTPEQVNSEIALIKGADILRNVAQTCGLANRWTADELFVPHDPSRIKAARIESAAMHLAKGVQVQTEKASNVITLKYGDLGNPDTPACVLQNIGKLYMQKRLSLRRPSDTLHFFAEQTEKYRQQLAQVETQLADFGHVEGVAAPDVLRTDMAQRVTASVAGLHATQQQIAGDEKRLSDDATQMRQIPNRITTQQSSNAASQLLQQLQGNLLAAQLKRQQLLVKYDPSYPLVREADEEVAKTQAAIDHAKKMNYANQTTDLNPTYQLLQEDSARTRLDLATQRANAGAMVGSISAMKQQMVDLDSKAVKQAALVREEKADEANYLLYLSKREQERTANAMDEQRIANVTIAVPAVPAALPAVNPLLFGFGGLTLALLLGIATALVLDWMDPTFRTSSEVTKALSLPVLAAIPKQIASGRVIALLPKEDAEARHDTGVLSSLLKVDVSRGQSERFGRQAGESHPPDAEGAPQDRNDGPTP
jgi:uncharacterized protein involved in exopolysaccharide biosynthesis